MFLFSSFGANQPFSMAALSWRIYGTAHTPSVSEVQQTSRTALRAYQNPALNLPMRPPWKVVPAETGSDALIRANIMPDNVFLLQLGCCSSQLQSSFGPSSDSRKSARVQ